VTQAITDRDFLREFGSYLRNVDHGLAPQDGRPGTCGVCGAPVDRWPRCYGCNQACQAAKDRGERLPLDDLAILSYAVEGSLEVKFDASGGSVLPAKHQWEGRQAYKVLKGYKTDTPDRGEWMAVIYWWTLWMLQRWGPDTLYPGVSYPQWHWATVPSRRSDRQGEHPFHRIVGTIIGQTHEEVVLELGSAEASRDYDPNAYTAGETARGVHVILVEDSWASGANVLSAAAAIKSAGASRVSAMVLGRILNPTFSPSAEFIKRGGLRSTFEPDRSPWVRVTT
jgi:hypothetical protein